MTYTGIVDMLVAWDAARHEQRQRVGSLYTQYPSRGASLFSSYRDKHHTSCSAVHFLFIIAFSTQSNKLLYTPPRLEHS